MRRAVSTDDETKVMIQFKGYVRLFPRESRMQKDCHTDRLRLRLPYLPFSLSLLASSVVPPAALRSA